MLRAEHVRARRRGEELQLLPLRGEVKQRALGYARAYVELVRGHLGRRREELEAALSAVVVPGGDRRLASGLRKLIEDRCHFEGADPEEAEGLRRALFERAAARRAALSEGALFPRDALIAEVAAEHGLSPEQLEERLYADLRAEQRLRSFEEVTPEVLVDGWDEAQQRAALLRAVRVTVHLEEGSPRCCRRLFARMRFLRLLHHIEPQGAGYRIEISGPEGILRASTRYGLQLAMLLPDLRRCGRWRLDAELRWGRERIPLRLRLQGAGGEEELEEPPLSEDAQGLLERFGPERKGWRCRPARTVLHVPGAGVCVPDLTFESIQQGVTVHCEVLGYWSRQAVWRRLDLADEGLSEPLLVCAPARLRVSEEIAEDAERLQLYVYKGRPAVREVLRRLEILAGRPGPGAQQRCFE